MPCCAISPDEHRRAKTRNSVSEPLMFHLWGCASCALRGTAALWNDVAFVFARNGMVLVPGTSFCGTGRQKIPDILVVPLYGVGMRQLEISVML